jgi:hypothetical protein|uniref:Uncharacterized protein n=1 Tax=virus sp. ctVE78 TaxID=2826804 RepID=A0A8S5R766_9VIRU|nr:MAG TPA: hypothetical protein [virus sp. ctVE78]
MIGIQLTADYEPHIRLVHDEEGRIIEGLALGETLPQNQALILTLHQGELKEAPAVGCGISDMLLDHRPLFWRARIREQLEMDGQTVTSIKITTTGIHIDARY